jgi:hypothetical protein
MCFDGDVPQDHQESDLKPLVCRLICSVCKRTRLDDGTWVLDEAALADLDRGCISHGICPDCLDEHYPEFL